MLPNKAKFNFEDLFLIFGKSALHNIDFNVKCNSLKIDSRQINKGDAFLALKGENLDGHTKIIDAIKKGASFAVADKTYYLSNKELYKDLPLIIVNNTEKALGDIANYHRNRFNIPIIAVAGSNGKTTTKELIATILEKKYKTLKTYKNYNNQLGVPLTLLQLDDTIEASVIEIGTNSIGEIDYLTNIVNPTHGLITNIGKEHLELLGDLHGVELEETALFSYLRKNNRIAFINTDDKRLRNYAKMIENHVAYGKIKNVQLNYKYSLDNNLFPIIDFDNEGKKFTAKVNLPGYPAVINSTAAATVGLSLDIPLEDIKSALESFKSPDDNNYGRLLIQEINNIKVINDCYNANPSSMSSALDLLSEFETNSNKYAILGDMLEMGENSLQEHKEILKKATNTGVNIFTFGDTFNSAAKDFNSVKPFTKKDKLIQEIKETIKANDIILVKGSRGMKMEEVITALK